MSNQHEGQWDDPRDIEPAYASDGWASRRGYEIAMAWGDSHEHKIGQADDIAHEFRKLRDHMQAQIDALRQELAAGQWEPLPDGIHKLRFGDKVDVSSIDTGDWSAEFLDENDEVLLTEYMPKTLRLCRLAPASLQAAEIVAQEEANDNR